MTGSPLFFSAFSRLIESFAPHFHKILYEFEDKMAACSGINVEKIIENIFSKFPRNLTQYQSLIKNLTKLASFDPGASITELSDIFKRLLSPEKDNTFQTLQNLSFIFKPDNVYHQELISRFGIYLISDLICQIIREYGYNDLCSKLTECGMKMCNSNDKAKLFDSTIKMQWAVIFSMISETNFKPIFDMFRSIIDLEDYGTAFFLVQYTRLDCIKDDNVIFLEVVYNLLIKLCEKPSDLVFEILTATSRLLLSQKELNDQVQNIFNFAWDLLKNKSYEEYAVYIICVLFPLFPDKRESVIDFYNTYIEVNISKKEYVEKTLHFFQILIYGIQFDPRWLYWEWGMNPRIHYFSYLKWNSQPDKPLSDENSFLSIFMRTFFTEANFSVCVQKFSDILLHFAALDFQYFMNSIMDKFLSISYNDPRFISFLMMIYKANSPGFLEYVSCSVTSSDLIEFNRKAKSKVTEALSVFNIEFLSEHGTRSDLVNSLETIIINSDLKVEKRLDEWKLNKIQKTVPDHGTYSANIEKYQDCLHVQIVKCLPFIIPLEDYNSPDMMKLILQLSFNYIPYISSVAYPICISIIKNNLMQVQFIEIILDFIKGPTSCESLFTCINLLAEMLGSNPQSLPLEVVHNIEFAGIRGLVSVHPTCRIISFHLLKMLNHVLLHEKGIYAFIENNTNEIQSAVFQRLMAHNDLEFNKSKVKPNKQIKFLQAVGSYYYDIWLFFICEIANIIVSTNYTPLLERFQNNLLSYIRALFSANSSCCGINNNGNGNASSTSPQNSGLLDSDFNSLPDSSLDLSSGDISHLFTTSSSDSQMNIGLLIFYIASHYNRNFVMKSLSYYKGDLYSPIEKNDDSLQKNAVSTIKHLLRITGLDKLAFSIIEHSHISLYPGFVNMLCNVRKDQLEDATSVVCVMIKSPLITSTFARELFRTIISFISVIQSYISSKKINGPRIISWHKNDTNIEDNSNVSDEYDSEEIVIKYKNLSIEFCSIITQILEYINNRLNPEEWPLASREIIFRYMMNWMGTTSPELAVLRKFATCTLTTMIRMGPILNDALFYDSSSIKIFSSIEESGYHVLSFLLYFHVELLLEAFIDACYTQPVASSNMYFLSLFMAIDADYSNFLFIHSASLLLLSFIAYYRENPRSLEFLMALLDVITQGKSNINFDQYFAHENSFFEPNPVSSSSQDSNLSLSHSQSDSNCDFYENDQNNAEILKYRCQEHHGRNHILKEVAKELSFLTEAIFEQGFRVIKMDNLQIPLKDIIDILIIWSRNIRLLPNQSSCISGDYNTNMQSIFHKTPKQLFHRFTPYSFLEQLMKTTESVSNDNLSIIITLWCTLLKMPDHNELIQIFIFTWPESFRLKNDEQYKKAKFTQFALISHLIYADSENIVIRIAQHCSFAFYYHITTGLDKDFDNELWIVPLLTEAFQFKNNENTFILIPSILHFAFLFLERKINGTHELLRVLCNSLDVELPDGALTKDAIISTVQLLVKALKSNSALFSSFYEKTQSISSGSGEMIRSKSLIDVDPVRIWGKESLKWLLGCQSLEFATISLIIFNQILKPLDSLVISGVCKAVTFHIVNLMEASQMDNPLLISFIEESFNFYVEVFKGNEMFAFQYASSFLDCKVFVDTCLDKATSLFLKCLMSNVTNSKARTLVIGMLRPLLPKIEVDEVTQKMLEICLINSPLESEELQMIAAPFHHCRKLLFQQLKSLDALLESASETTMCKALQHYAAIVSTASQSLLNSIYLISAYIVKRVVAENNREPLAVIYKSALRNLPFCNNAIDFICSVAKFEPVVATKISYEVYDWGRSLESVCRSLYSLIQTNEKNSKIVTLTDCSTIQSVYNLLNCDTIPKILPFTSQRKMLESLKNTVNDVRFEKIKNNKLNTSGGFSSNSFSTTVPYTPPQIKLVPLKKPTEILQNSSLFHVKWPDNIELSSSDFYKT